MSDDIVRLGLVVDANGFVRADKAMQDFTRTAATAEQRTSELNKEMDGLSTFAKRATQVLGVLAASFGAREIIQYADAWRSLSNQIRLVTDSEEQFTRVREGVVSAAKNSNAELGATASLYSTLARYSGDLVKSDSELLRITETLNKSFAVSGASADSQAGAIRQLSQALASGALRGDEFNSVNENAPRIMDAIAASLNMTKGELREFAAEGKITSKIIIDAVRGMAGEIDSDFAKMDKTFAQYVQNAKTNATEFLGNNAAVQSATKAAGEAILAASEHMDALMRVAEGAAVVMVARVTPALWSTTTATIAATAENIRYQMALARMAGLSTAAAVSSATLGRAMAFFGGPAGVATLAAGALYLWYQNAKEANQPTLDLAQSVDQLAESYRNLGYYQRLQSQEDVTQKLADNASQLADKQKELQSLENQLKAQRGNWADAEERLIPQINDVKAAIEGLRSDEEKLLTVRKEYARLDAIIKKQDIEDFLVYNGWITKTSKSVAELTEKEQKVIDALKQQTAMLGMTEREAFVYQETLKLGNEASEGAINQARELAERYYDLTHAVDGQVFALASEMAMLHMTERQAVIYEARLQKINEGAGPEAVKLAGEMAAALYDQTEAHKNAADAAEEATKRSRKAAEDAAKAHDKASKQIIEDYRDMREDLSSIFQDVLGDWENAGDAMEKIGKRVALSIAGDFLAAMSLDALGANPTGKGFSLAGSLGNAGAAGKILSAGLNNFAPNLAVSLGLAGDGAVITAREYEQLMGGRSTGQGFNLTNLKDLGYSIGAGIAGGYVGNELGEALFGKQANSNWGATAGGAAGAYLGGPIGSAIGSAIGAMVDAAFGGDGKQRVNQGFLVGNTPGAKQQYLGEQYTFASGVQVQAMTRRGDTAATKQIIETFKQVDQSFVDLVEALGGKVSVDQLRGLDEEATRGSIGNFFGLGGNGQLAGDVIAQVNSWVDQLADHVSGLDKTLLSSVQSAGSAEDALALLTEAVAKHTKLAGLDEQKIRDTIRLTLEKSESEYQALQTLTKMADEAGLGLDGIGIALGASVSDLERWINRVTLANQGYESSLAAVANELERQQRLSLGLTGLADAFRFDRMSEQERLSYTEKAFNDTLSSALRGDSAAAEQLRTAADAYARQAGQSNLAVSAYESIMDRIISGLDKAAQAVSGVGAMLPSITGLINQSLESGRSEQYIANLLAGLGGDAQAAGDKVMPGLSRSVTSDRDILARIRSISSSSSTEYEAAIRISEEADRYGIAYDRIMDLVGMSEPKRRYYTDLIDGSHADGLDYVPFDGYLAELHQGERVTSAAQVQADDNNAEALAEAVKKLVAAIPQMMLTMTTAQMQAGDNAAAALAQAAKQLAAAKPQAGSGRENREVVAAIDNLTAVTIRLAESRAMEVTG